MPAIEYNPSCQDRCAGLFFLGSLDEGDFPPFVNSRPGAILADTQEEFRTEGFCFMATEGEREKKRVYYARKRQDPKWLAVYSQKARESSLRSYWRNKDKLKTPEQLASRHQSSNSWYQKARLAPGYREKCNASATRSRERCKERMLTDAEYRESRRAYAREYNRKRRLTQTVEAKAHETEIRRASQRKIRASLTPEQRAIRNAQKREWMRSERARKPDHVRSREKALRDSNPSVKLARNLRCRLWQAVRGKAKKAASTIELVGCSPEALRLYLESLFLPGMSWANYNHSGWHVDHIKACTQFDLADPAQQRECFHYSNLQPLWAADNQRKYNK